MNNISEMVKTNNISAEQNRYYAQHQFSVEQYHRDFPALATVRDMHQGENLQVENPTADQLPESIVYEDDPICLQQVVSQSDGTLRMGKEMMFVRRTVGGNVILKDSEQSKLEPIHQLSPDVQQCCQHLIEVHQAHINVKRQRIRLEAIRESALCSK